MSISIFTIYFPFLYFLLDFLSSVSTRQISLRTRVSQQSANFQCVCFALRSRRCRASSVARLNEPSRCAYRQKLICVVDAFVVFTASGFSTLLALLLSCALSCTNGSRARVETTTEATSCAASQRHFCRCGCTPKNNYVRHTHTHTRTHSVADKKHPRPRTLAQRRLTSFGRSLVVCLSVVVYAVSLSLYLQPGADRLVGCFLVTVQVSAPLSARAAPVLLVLIFSHFYSKTIKSVFLTCNTLHRMLCSAPAWARMCCSNVVVAVFLSLFLCSILSKLKEVK